MVAVYNQRHAVPEYYSLQNAISGDRGGSCLCRKKTKLAGYEVDTAQNFFVTFVRNSHAMVIERPDCARSFKDLGTEVLVSVQFLGI